MDSASHSDLLEHFKIETHFRRDYTVEITRIIQPEWHRRAVKTEKKWTKKSDLGYGSFGEVWLEEDQSGNTRAVKCVKKKRYPRINYSKELLAMANLSKVRNDPNDIKIIS